MKFTKNNKGFTLIELIVVIAIIAILAAVAVPSYQQIQNRAERAAAISNAANIASCLNGHNALVETDETLSAITGSMTGTSPHNGAEGVIILSGVKIEGGSAVDNVNTLDLFNEVCENQISGMTVDDFNIALDYVTILSNNDEFGVREDYDHTS